jgi:magnesium-transporting ATPase (P-type)
LYMQKENLKSRLTDAKNECFCFFSILPSNELVVEGPSLEFALDHSLRNDFIELCCKCSSVICCRVSPMQKAEMVELVIEKNLFTLRMLNS